eukprot:scaffold98838_cov69-Phaeocystis_antarctica.AAC.9
MPRLAQNRYQDSAYLAVAPRPAVPSSCLLYCPFELQEWRYGRPPQFQPSAVQGLLERAECVGGAQYFRLQLRRVHAVPRRRADAQLHLRPRAVQLKRGGGRADQVVSALHRDARDVPDALHALEQRLVLEETVVHLDA